MSLHPEISTVASVDACPSGVGAWLQQRIKKKAGNSMLNNIEYRKLFLIVGLIWIFGFLIATLPTPDVISSSYLSSGFCKWVGCKSWMKDSEFPEIATLYFSIVWISFPFWICIWWKWLISKVGKDESGIKIMLKHKMLLVICLPICVFLSYFLIFLYSGGDSRLIKFGSSEIGLACGGMAIPAGAAGLVCFVFSL